MSPSGALVLTAHADSRLRISTLPKPGILDEPLTEQSKVAGGVGAGGGGSQKFAKGLLFFTPSSPLESGVSVALSLFVFVLSCVCGREVC